MSNPARIASVVDLFSGAGGFSLGFAAAGCRVQGALDADETAGRTFEQNFRVLQPEAPPDVFYGDAGDLSDFDVDRLAAKGTPDILIGGPPCQGFSRVGRAKLDSLTDEGYAGDARNELYRRFLDVAELWKPLAIVMENVPGMLSVDGRNIAIDAAQDIATRGYIAGYAVLNAAWYGVPQFRERLFFVGLRKDLGVRPVVPPATHKADLPAGYMRPLPAYQFLLPFVTAGPAMVDIERASLGPTSVSEALDDLPELTDHLSADPVRGDFRRLLTYRCPPHSEYAHLMRSWAGFPSPQLIDDHVVRRTPRDYETFRRMNHGDRYPEALAIATARLSERLEELRREGRCPALGTPEFRELERRFVPPYPDDIFVDKWRKLFSGEPSWTVTAHLAKDTYSHIHHDSQQARSISVREAARLQSFPDAFRFEGNMGDCFRQIGNAVPPLMAWAIASCLMSALGFQSKQPPLNERLQVSGVELPESSTSTTSDVRLRYGFKPVEFRR